MLQTILVSVFICLMLEYWNAIVSQLFLNTVHSNLTTINIQKSTNSQLFLSILNHSYTFLCSVLHVFNCDHMSEQNISVQLFSILTLFLGYQKFICW
jgi:hypothetical protein